MIEEIKLLIPLLQSAGVGAVWLVLAFLVKELIIYGSMVVAIAFIFHKGLDTWRQVEMKNDLKSQVMSILTAYGYVSETHYYDEKARTAALLKLVSENPYVRPKD